ncbi:MAG: cytochrome b [Filomicrobium sp.]
MGPFKLTNSTDTYGAVSRILHWGMAIAIFAMFALGLWMRTLDYYSPWYQQAPNIHKSIGIILLALLVLRLIWRLANVQPDDSHLKPIERRISKATHWAFYAILFALMVSGYFISTVDGRAIDVFDWFAVPSIYVQKGLEDTFGIIHEYLAYLVMALAGIHAAAALKHHFYDRDITLRRMWSGRSTRPYTSIDPERN